MNFKCHPSVHLFSVLHVLTRVAGKWEPYPAAFGTTGKLSSFSPTTTKPNYLLNVSIKNSAKRSQKDATKFHDQKKFKNNENNAIRIYQLGKGYNSIPKGFGHQQSTVRAFLHTLSKHATAVTLPGVAALDLKSTARTHPVSQKATHDNIHRTAALPHQSGYGGPVLVPYACFCYQ